MTKKAVIALLIWILLFTLAYLKSNIAVDVEASKPQVTVYSTLGTILWRAITGVIILVLIQVMMG